MTDQRLLVRSLGAASWEPARDELRHAADAVVHGERGLRVLATALPLMRRRADGLPGQVLRLRAIGADPPPRLHVTATDRSGATAAGTLAPPARTLDLLVPAVQAPSELTVHLRIGDSPTTLVRTVPVAPQRRWTIHLIQHSHLDIGYTDPQGSVLRHHLRYLDDVLDLHDATSGWPDDARFRWTVESNLVFRRWLRRRPASARDRMRAAIADGSVEVTALPATLHTEACSAEELSRALRGVDELRAQHGIEVRSAMQSDVPGAAAGLVDALARVGVRYLSVAHNYAGRSTPHALDGHELTRPFWWRSAAGNRVLTWLTDTPHGIAYMEGNLVGLDESVEAALELLPLYLRALATQPFPYMGPIFGWNGPPPATKKLPYPHDVLHLRVQGDRGDNAGPSLLPAEIARRWNDEWEAPRLRCSTNTEFFADVERRLDGRIDEFGGDWSDWWADGLGANARALGQGRHAQADLRRAETLHAIADLRDGAVDADAQADLDAAHDRLLLFDEHTWGAGNPWRDKRERHDSGALQWTWKAATALDARDGALDLLDRAAVRLAAQWRRAEGALASIAAINTCGWRRTEIVAVPVPHAVLAPDVPFEVVDTRDGTIVPHVVDPGDHTPFRPRVQHLRFLARDITPGGFVRFDVCRLARAGDMAAEPLGSALVVEGPAARLEVDGDDGAVRSLLLGGRELVDPRAATRLNLHVHERYGSAPRINHLSGSLVAPDLTLLVGRSTPRLAHVVAAQRTALETRVEIALQVDGARGLRSTYTLPHHAPRLEIANRVDLIADDAKQAGYFAFPLATTGPPRLAYEVTGGVVATDAPRVPGSARHMAAMRHWLTVQDDERRVAWATLEAALVQIGALHLPYSPFPATLAETEPATVYSWAYNNIWDTNFPGAQGGEVAFRYAVATDAEAALGPRTALTLTDPLVGVLLTGGAEAAPVSGQLLATEGDDRVELRGLGWRACGRELVVTLAGGDAGEGDDFGRAVSVDLSGLGVSRVRASTPGLPGDPPTVDGARVHLEVPAATTVELRLGVEAADWSSAQP